MKHRFNAAMLILAFIYIVAVLNFATSKFKKKHIDATQVNHLLER